jgi:hypothetical protein
MNGHYGQDKGGEYKVYMEKDSVPYPFEQDTNVRETLDDMGDEELEEAGITRIDPSIVTSDVAEDSPFELSQTEPSYIAEYPLSVEKTKIDEREQIVEIPEE